jgi:hypothetical protein
MNASSKSLAEETQNYKPDTYRSSYNDKEKVTGVLIF